MSRTYRTIMKMVDCGCGASLWNWGMNTLAYAVRHDEAPRRECQHHLYDYYSRHNLKRDKKPWNKPSKEFKKWKKRKNLTEQSC